MNTFIYGFITRRPIVLLQKYSVIISMWDDDKRSGENMIYVEDKDATIIEYAERRKEQN